MLKFNRLQGYVHFSQSSQLIISGDLKHWIGCNDAIHRIFADRNASTFTQKRDSSGWMWRRDSSRLYIYIPSLKEWAIASICIIRSRLGALGAYT